MNKLLFLLLLLLSAQSNAQTLQQDTTLAAQLIAQASSDDFAKAVAIYNKWKLNEKAHQTKAKWALQLVYPEMPEQIEQAEELYLELLLSAQNNPNFTPSQGDIYIALGEIYRVKNSSDQSIEYQQKALTFFDETQGKDSPAHIKVYQALGRTYLYEKHAYQEAVEYFTKANALFAQHATKTDPALAPRLQNELATAYRYAREYSKALLHFNKTFELLKKYPNPELLLITYSNTGTVYTNMGDFEKAVGYFEKAVAVLKQYNLPFNRRVLAPFINLADMCRLRGESAEAIKQFKDILPLVEQYFGKKSAKVADIYNKMCVTFFQTNDLDSVLLYAQRCINTCIPDFNDFDIRSNPRVDEAFRTVDDINLLLGLINKTIAANDAFKEAQEPFYGDLAYETSLTAFDFFRYVEDKYSEPKDKLQMMFFLRVLFEHALFAALNKFEKTNDLSCLQTAINTIEYSKSLLLRKSLQRDESLLFGGVPDSLIQQEKQLKQQIVAYEKKLAIAERGKKEKDILAFKEDIFDSKASLKDFQQKIETQYPKFHQLKANQQMAQITQIQGSLPANAAFVSYFCYQPYLYTVVVTKDSSWGFQLDIPAFEPKLDSFIKLLPDVTFLKEKPDTFTRLYTQQACMLHGWLIDSLHLPAHIKHLVVSPDHHLHYLPFEALLRTPAQGADFTRFDYLLQHYAVTYTYSASLLLQLQSNADQRNNQANNRMLAMAAAYPKTIPDSVYLKRTDSANRTFRNNLDDLPGAKNEVEQMKALYQGSFLLDTAANERNFKRIAADYGIIHFAMHGIMNEKIPANSGLVFSETFDTTEDDMLYAYEINNLNLNAQLVVLSACETGVGKFESGEGVMSIARSFMYAGTSAVVATLWQVNDVSTAKIMDSFYKNLSNNMDKAEALRQAKLHYLEKAQGIAAHPAFWAAPVQLGDFRPLQVPQRQSRWLWIGGIAAAVLVLVFALRRFLQNRHRKEVPA